MQVAEDPEIRWWPTKADAKDHIGSLEPLNSVGNGGRVQYGLFDKTLVDGVKTYLGSVVVSYDRKSCKRHEDIRVVNRNVDALLLTHR